MRAGSRTGVEQLASGSEGVYIVCARIEDGSKWSRVVYLCGYELQCTGEATVAEKNGALLWVRPANGQHSTAITPTPTTPLHPGATVIVK